MKGGSDENEKKKEKENKEKGVGHKQSLRAGVSLCFSGEFTVPVKRTKANGLSPDAFTCRQAFPSQTASLHVQGPHQQCDRVVQSKRQLC